VLADRDPRKAVRSEAAGMGGGRARYPTLGDVDSPAALERYQEAKRAYKASLRRAPA
jgi:hypothetical protein